MVAEDFNRTGAEYETWYHYDEVVLREVQGATDHPKVRVLMDYMQGVVYALQHTALQESVKPKKAESLRQQAIGIETAIRTIKNQMAHEATKEQLAARMRERTQHSDRRIAAQRARRTRFNHHQEMSDV